MNKIRLCFIVAAVAAFPLTNASAADSDVTVTVGLKGWDSNWNSWDPVFASYSRSPAAGTPLTPVVKTMETKGQFTLTPSVSIRYQNFLLAGSLMANRSFDFPSDQINNVHRKEYDVSAGYYVLPTLAIVGGYKQVEYDFADKWKYTGPFVGVLGSAPLTGGFSLYGSAAMGPLKLAVGDTAKLDGDYRLSEVGLAYAFDGAGMGTKAVIATIGYRNQLVITKLTGTHQGFKGRDTTDGITIGIAAAF